MKKSSVSTPKFPAFSSFALRRLSAAALLCCAVAGAPAVSWAAPGDEAALNFVGADIESVIKAVGHYTNINFVIDPRVKGTITLVSEKSITKTQAFGLLASALRLQGFAVVSGDGYAKVVPEAEAKLQSVPTQVGGGASTVKGDQIASQVFYLNYESSANLVTALRPLISPNNTINANPGNNSLVITDYADNLKRLGKIIAALDTPATSDLDVIPVRYAIASDLATMVNKLMEPSVGADTSGKVSVLADPRTNSLVLRAPSLARANLAKSLIAKLDQPTAQLGNVHVVYLKNADATKLAQTLRAVVASDGSANNTQQGGANSGNTVNNANNNSGSGGSFGSSQSSAGGGTGNGGGNNAALTSGPQQLSSGGAAGFIQADASTNTLILTCPEAVYRNLRAVIDQLDVRRAQVYIEALIVEVTSDKASEFGVQWLGLTGDNKSNYRIGGAQTFTSAGPNNLLTLAAGNATTLGSKLPGSGLNIGIFKQINGALGLGALVHALESDNNTNILSTPNMITLDNELATIRVGQNVPILTGQFTNSSGNNQNPFQTIDRKDVGLTLKVRPQISEGGTIKLAIYHETSSVDQGTLTNQAGITINSRVIENNVVADDGQIIVLGGLIEDATGDGAEKVRGLGDIPVLGNLFKYQTRTRKKTNLMIFLRPVVVRSKEQSTSLATDRYDYMRDAETSAVPQDGNLMLRNLGAPLLPSLQNGQPVGGSMVVHPVPPAPPRAPDTPENAATPASK
ncbi:type II secretion system secretin GspD [Janthinobacterium agaricidamnosum]|uniref:General secretion pathway protein D n=1 Tax=Janthinobacterium agaricidamnosum NBRC 102515 = DSM 9628 TaxID=1349767 RepID=W0VA07_9BURK|nr:type II secretion system secretin GspD [Janthinobacterium agaricidamnosum]CDG85654.1 general secretion pathway protein D [Janthinobacterium agaricidamnosum NBRC 102515 = DSM 9628]